MSLDLIFERYRVLGTLLSSLLTMNGDQNTITSQFSSGTSSYVITAIIAFVIGFGSAWFIYNKNGTFPKTTKTDTSPVVSTNADNISNESVSKDMGSTVQNPSTTANGDTVISVANTVSVSNQAAGAQVMIDKVTLAKPAWIAITETDEAGNLTRILGAALFDVGTHLGIVDLLRGTLPGKIYYAVIREDNGDDAFDPKKDVASLDESGKIIMASFKTE